MIPMSVGMGMADRIPLRETSVMNARRFASGILVVALAAPAAAETDPATRAAMQEILQAIAFALPRSMDAEAFGRPEERERISKALAQLASESGSLEQHAAARGAGFQHLGENLAADAREVEQRYNAGRTQEAAFLLQRLTENCIACHSRLPSRGDSDLSRRLMSDMAEVQLSPPERARLETATRQFDAALSTYEELFRSSQTTPAQLDLMGYLADYLTVALRVKGEAPRVVATLETLQQREDVPEWLERDLKVWIETLRAKGPPGGEGTALERARRLLAESDALRDVPADQTGLVHDLLASSLLYRYTEEHPQGGADVAEAYYLLGVIEARVDRSYWLSNADFYLETSIRMAPRAPFALDAYSLLAEHTEEGYTGSAGTYVPPDVQARLDELKTLVSPPDP
jgi:tetratricopeptide (TPR) repeat protein